MEEFKIITFDPLTAGDALWEKYLDSTEAICREYEPDEPMLPRARRKEMTVASLPNPYSNDYIYLALAAGGAPAGLAHLTAETPASPTYAENRLIGGLRNLSVAAPLRRRGLGTRLLGHALRDLALKEPLVAELVAGASLESGRRFLEKNGGELSLEDSENRLYLADADWALMERWAAEGASRNPGSRVITAAAIPEADLAEYVRAYNETLAREPKGELDGSMQITPGQVRHYEKKMREKGMIETTIYTREKDGRVSGLTETTYLPELPWVVRQGMTGVPAEFSGRGLGKLLKARMLLHIRKEFPAAKYVLTANADINAPMLAINNRLGFKRHRAFGLYKLKITAALLG